MLYIDASRYSNIANRTGVENYSFFLINEMVRQMPKNITLVTPRRIDLPVCQFVLPFPRLWTQVRLSWEVWCNRSLNNLFVPSHLLPLIHPKNTAITIHDVAFRRFPKSYGLLSRWYLDFGIRFAVRHARKIIVPSVATRDDLIHFYKADPHKIHVIPLGFTPPDLSSSSQSSDSILEKYSLKPQRYFLFVGRIESKKNVAMLISAFKQCRSDHPNVKLVLAGKPGVGGKEILKVADDLNIIVTGYLSEAEKWALFSHCLAFVLPSLFEGFGLPLLEAMHANVPIIASHIPSSVEVAKENALFFDPADTAALARHLQFVAKHPSLPKLTAHHQKTLERYSWKKCAEETLKILTIGD